MKLTATQENLTHALAQVSPIAAKGGTLPILQNILLEAKEGALQLKATNLEIGISAHVRGKVEQEGTFTVQGKLFQEYVSLLSKDSVSLMLEGDHLAIRAGNQQTKIHGLSADEFPVIPSMDGGTSFSIDGKDFREALSQVLFAVSLSDSRPEISGVLLSVVKNSLTLVGTDSYRLAERKIELQSEVAEPLTTIVPMRTMQELARIVGHAEGALKITVTDNQVLFAIEDVELISRVITGTFPDYREIIPVSSNTTVTIDTEPLVRAIKSASLFCKQGLNHVSFQFSSDKILVSASASQVGENVIEVPAKIEGNDVDIIFDYRYVLDGLHALGTSEVMIKLTNGSSPGLFVPQKGDDYVYLVMPIKQ